MHYWQITINLHFKDVMVTIKLTDYIMLFGYREKYLQEKFTFDWFKVLAYIEIFMDKY